MIWPWIVKYCSRQKMRLTHNTLLVPFGDFVAVFRPTFIWYSFVNVAGRKKILSPQLFSWRILSGTSTMQKQFPLAFLFLSSQRSRKNRKKTLLGFSKKWCLILHNSLLWGPRLDLHQVFTFDPKKHTSKAKVNPCNQLLLKEQDHQALALNIKKKFYFYSPQIYGHVADILLPFFWRAASVLSTTHVTT